MQKQCTHIFNCLEYSLLCASGHLHDFIVFIYTLNALPAKLVWEVADLTAVCLQKINFLLLKLSQ